MKTSLMLIALLLGSNAMAAEVGDRIYVNRTQLKCVDQVVPNLPRHCSYCYRYPDPDDNTPMPAPAPTSHTNAMLTLSKDVDGISTFTGSVYNTTCASLESTLEGVCGSLGLEVVNKQVSKVSATVTMEYLGLQATDANGFAINLNGNGRRQSN